MGKKGSLRGMGRSSCHLYEEVFDNCLEKKHHTFTWSTVPTTSGSWGKRPDLLLIGFFPRCYLHNPTSVISLKSRFLTTMDSKYCSGCLRNLPLSSFLAGDESTTLVVGFSRPVFLAVIEVLDGRKNWFEWEDRKRRKSSTKGSGLPCYPS